MQSAPAQVAATVNPNPLVGSLSNKESPKAHKNTKLQVLVRVFRHKKQEEAIINLLYLSEINRYIAEKLGN